MSKPAPHSLTDSQFINLILNPVKEDGSPDPDGFYFKPLSDELVVNEETGGMMLQDPQAYLYRFLQGFRLFFNHCCVVFIIPIPGPIHRLGFLY